MATKPSSRGGVLSPATVSRTYRSIQQLFRWLADEEEIESDPFVKMKPPKVPERPVPVITDDELRRLLEVVRGNAFEPRRDNAILRLLIETGMRAGELVGLKVGDLDFEADVALVLAKGRRPLAAPFGAMTGDALRRYLRTRAKHPQAASEALWLGTRNRGAMTLSGVAQMIRRRGVEAGIPGLHPHRFRHTFAHRWLADGNQETDLMRLERVPRILRAGCGRPGGCCIDTI